MTRNSFKLSIIKKYWQNTPEFFSEKYKINFLKLVSPVNLFLYARRKESLKLAGSVKGKKILDVGCGSGVFLLEFIKMEAKVVGVDYSQKMLNIAKKELKHYKIPKNKYKLILANATNLPFKNKSFDLVLATGLTDYMTDQDDLKFLKEASRVLKPNGSLIVSFPVEKSPFSFLRRGTGLAIRQRLFKLPPLRNEFTLEKIKRFLKTVNMKYETRRKIFTTMWLILAKFE